MSTNTFDHREQTLLTGVLNKALRSAIRLAPSVMTLLVVCHKVNLRPPLYCSTSATTTPILASISAKCSIVNSGGAHLLYLAILCKTSMAASSLPRPIRYLGDSWKSKRKNRAMKTSKVIPPRTPQQTLHPKLLLGEQQGSPSATSKQAGRGGVVVGHRYLGTVPNVMADATTTPIGCQMESKDKRNRRFCGKNSRAGEHD